MNPNDQDRFEYEVERAMIDWEYRVNICTHDIEMAFQRLHAEKESIVAEIIKMAERLHESATRSPAFGNADKSPF